MEQLFQFLESIHPFSSGLRSALVEKLRTKTVLKKEHILNEGQVCNNIYFIHDGFFRSYYIKDTKEITQWFMKTGDVIISVSSFYKRIPSYEFIQCMSDAEISFISYQDLQELYKNFPEFNFIGRTLTEKYYLLSDERSFGLRKQKAEERYELLLEHNKDILQLASLTDIASYLGISLETLSRIRAKK
jgi:CRP/FNR family transcriptional regulator, anaerobic regulatory protein